MGVGVLADSPIKTPKDLENKTVGWTPTSGEVPFFPVFAKLAGIDQDKIKFVNMNIDVRYRAFMDKQIDAITDFAASALPPLAARGYKVRWMLYASYGIHLYESALFTTSKTIKENPELCQGMVDGMMEALAFSYLNPEESIEIYFKEVREAGFVAKERENVRMGFGIANFSGLADEARLNGLGWSDAKRFGEMADLVLTYLAKGAQKPAVEELFTNRFAGRIKLTEAQWADAKKRNEEFAKFFA
jgi:NitT/TauT family transport system substrate-binding protein